MKKSFLILYLVIVVSVCNFAQTKRHDVLDDGFTWLEAVNGEALGANNIPVSTGWYLKIYLRVLGEYPNRY